MAELLVTISDVFKEIVAEILSERPDDVFQFAAHRLREKGKELLKGQVLKPKVNGAVKKASPAVHSPKPKAKAPVVKKTWN